MAIRLKNDWKAHGNNPTARRVADWMNTVADLFNFAHVPSGGTAQPTERGFQIEVDGGNGDGSPQLDHAFLPTQTAATTATLTPGYVTDRNGTRYSIEGAIIPGAAWGGGVINFASPNKCWWVSLVYEHEEGTTQGNFKELRWNFGASFPVHRTNSGWTVNIPVIEFPDNDWASMIRRQTNDIMDGPHTLADMGEQPSPDPDEPWPEPPPYDTIPGRPDIPDDQDGFDSGTPVGNRRHYNLSSLTERDDHHGDRAAVSGVTGKNVYIHPDGDFARNAMAGVIGTGVGGWSFDPHGRILYTGTNDVAMIWGSRRCYSSLLILSIDWANRILHDEAEEPSANWDTRKLYADDGSTITLDWLLRQLAGGDWTVTEGDFDVSGAGKVYKHLGVAGVTGSGFSGGIKTGEGSEEAYQESAVDVTLTAASSFANMTATATATLPASVAGRRFTIAATAAGGATVAANGTELINGQATQTLSQYDAMTVIGTGTGWIII